MITIILILILQMKGLRTSGDENARIMQAHIMQGMDPPQGLRHDFQEFLLLVSVLFVYLYLHFYIYVCQLCLNKSRNWDVR